MFGKNNIDSVLKPLALGLASAVLLSACGSNTDNSKSASNMEAPLGTYEIKGDHAIGNPNAEVTIVEYASVTCGACANWHMSVYPDLKKKYIDTGKVRYIFREFPTQPENLARAGFMIANCAGEDRFLENISIQFKQQKALLGAPNKAQAYLNLAKASGLSEAEYEACLTDEDRNARYESVVQGGIDAGVTGTPSFFINGEKKKVFKIEDFDEALTPLLAGENTPIQDAAE